MSLQCPWVVTLQKMDWFLLPTPSVLKLSRTTSVGNHLLLTPLEDTLLSYFPR